MGKTKRILIMKEIAVTYPVEDYCSDECAHLKINEGLSNYCREFKRYLPQGVRCVECVIADNYSTGIMADIANLYSTVKNKEAQ